MEVPTTGPRRDRQILETLKAGFSVESRVQDWAAELEWLFEHRGAALHHDPKYTEGEPHPLSPGGRTSIEHSTHRAETCTRSVNLLTDVLVTCIQKPMPELEQWASDMRASVDVILVRRGKLDVSSAS